MVPLGGAPEDVPLQQPPCLLFASYKLSTRCTQKTKPETTEHAVKRARAHFAWRSAPWLRSFVAFVVSVVSAFSAFSSRLFSSAVSLASLLLMLASRVVLFPSLSMAKN